MLTADRSRLRLYFTDLFEFIFTSNVAHFNFTFNLKTSQEPDATFKVFEGLERVGLEVKKNRKQANKWRLVAIVDVVKYFSGSQERP